MLRVCACAADLYTTNVAYLSAAFLEGRASLLQVCKSWFHSFFGNLVGSLLVVWLLDEVWHAQWPPGICHLNYAGSADCVMI